MIRRFNPALSYLLAAFIWLVLWLGLAPSVPAADMDTATAQKVATAVVKWNGENPGDLFKAVKHANPEAGAITSLRELNRFMSTLSPEIRQAIVENQNIAQRAIRDKILSVREAYYQRYRANNPEKARSLYGHGDIGSWSMEKRDRPPNAEMDVDWTAFGADRDVTAEVRNGYNAELLRELVGDNPEHLDLIKDFDIVATAEGRETDTHVFETRGGIDWAMRNMRRITILLPDGTSKTYDLSKGTDPVFELAMNQHLAELRTLATKGGDYGKLFDATGNLLPQDKIPRELWDRYTKQLKAVDYYISKRETATGGCLDMAKHLNEEVAQKTYEPIATAKKVIKYVYRADNIARGAKIPEKLIASDPVLGDAANVEMVAFSKQVTFAKSEAEAIELVRNRMGGDPDDAALQSLTERAKKVTLRYSELAFQAEMDRIVLEVNTRAATKAALANLAREFKMIADEGGEYTDLAESALDAIAKMSEANDAGAVEALRENWNSLEKIRQTDDTLANRTRNYLNQTELGKKILDKYGKVLEYAGKPVFGTGKPYHTSPMLDVIDGAVEAAHTRGVTMVQFLGSAAMWMSVVDNVRTAKTDAELAIKLGETLALNTYYGMIASSLYAGIVQGDAHALAKAIMYMIVPETALPALVEALGQSAISLGAQILFDQQLDAQYALSGFDDQGHVKNIDDYSGRERAALALINDFLTPGGETLAVGMFEKATSRMEQLGWNKLTVDEFRGMDAIGKRALVRSIESTVLKGNPLVLKDDGQLVAACTTIKKYTDEINELGKTLNLQIPETVNAGWIEGFDLGRGEKGALKKLMAARADAQDKAKNALAAGIIRVFEERKRAESELAKGRDEALAMLKEVEQIFEELKIHDEGMKALEQEGTYTRIMGWFTVPREQQIKAMQAVLKFRDAYRFVLEARNRAEEMARTNMGDGYSTERRPLTGPFTPVTAPTISTDFVKAGVAPTALSGPLLIDAAIDTQNGQKYLKDAAAIGASITKDLELIKGGRLDSDYDREMFRKLYRVRFERAYWSLMFDVANQAKGMLNMAQVWRESQRNSAREEAFTKGQALIKEDQTLQEEFKLYYARAKATISINGVKESPPDAPVDLAATVTFQTKPEPAYEVRWSDETRQQALPRGSSITFKPADAPKYTVKAEVFATIQGKPLKVAEAFHDIAIKKKDEIKKDEDKPDQTRKGEIKLTAPASVNATQVFAVSGRLPPEIAAKAKSFGWGWESDGDYTTTPATKVQFRPGSNGKQEIRVVAFDGPIVEKNEGKWREASGQQIGSGSVTVNVTELLLDAKASDIWEGGIAHGTSDPYATLNFTRKPEYRKRTQDGKEVNSANASGNIKVELSADTKPVDCSAAHRLGGKPLAQGYKIRAVTIGEFKGDVIETPFNKRYKGNEYGYVDVSYPEANISAAGCVSNGKQYMQISYSAWAAGEALGDPGHIWWDDMPWVEQKARQIHSDVVAILGSIKLTPDGKLHREPYKEKPIASVRLESSKKGKLKKGETVDVRAIVENAEAEDGKPVYTWSGDHAGTGEKVQFLASKGGKQTLSVSVQGARWSMGSASIEFEVDAGVKVEITKTSPSDNRLPVGSRAGFSARIVDGASGTAYVYRWQPHPEVTFDKLDSATPDVNATFTKPGKVKVWVTVLEKKDGALATAGESDQLEMEVVVPKLELAFEPKEAYVGQEVKARVTAKSDAKEIDFRWFVPGNVKQLSESQDKREISFYARDDKPAEMKVTARVPKSGEDLGEAKESMTARKYEVSVTGPKLTGPKPRVWKEKVGLVEVNDAIAADQVVELSPDLKPAPRSEPLRYEWKVTAGRCAISNPASRDARITCSETGVIEAIVTIKDKNDIELGKGKGGFNVSISRETIKQSKDKADAATKDAKQVQEAAQKLRNAKDLARKGKLDEAIKEAEESAKLDPANKEARSYADQLKKEKEIVQAQLDKTKRLIDESQFAEAQKELIVAKNLHGSYPPVQDAEKLLGDKLRVYNDRMRDQIYAVRSANEHKEFKKALDMAEVLRKTTKVRDFNDDQLKQQENWARMWEAEKEKKRQAFKAAAEKLKNYDYQGSLTAFDETFINAGNVFNGSEAEYTEAVRLRQEAYAKNKQLMELLPFVQRAAEDTQSSLPPEGLQNALKSADQAIALQPTNERTKKYRAAIEAKLAKLTSDNQKSQDLKNRTDGAKQWRTQGETQQKQGKIADAIASYRQSLKFVSDKALEDHVRLLEAEAAKQSEKRAAAEKAWQEGTALFNQGKPSEALTRLKESLSLLPDAQRSQYVKDLEGRQTKARQLRDEGAKLQQQNRVVDAVSRYNESLTYWPDPKLREHITALEAKQKEGQAEESKKARAKQLRDEGYALQQQSRLKEAVAKYRESLSYWPDPQLEKYVKDIEARMAASSGGSTASGPVASTPAKPPASQPPVQTSSASINIVGAWQTTHHDKGQKVAAGLTHFYKDGTMVIEASKVETAEKGQFIVCRINGSWKMSASTLTVSPGKSECRMPNGTTRTDDFSGDPYSGTVTGDGKSFTAVFGPGMQTTYVRQ